MDVAEVNRFETVSMGKNWFFQSHNPLQFVQILCHFLKGVTMALLVTSSESCLKFWTTTLIQNAPVQLCLSLWAITNSPFPNLKYPRKHLKLFSCLECLDNINNMLMFCLLILLNEVFKLINKMSWIFHFISLRRSTSYQRMHQYLFIFIAKCGYGDTEMHLRILSLLSQFRILVFYSTSSTITVNVPFWFVCYIFQISCYTSIRKTII